MEQRAFLHLCCGNDTNINCSTVCELLISAEPLPLVFVAPWNHNQVSPISDKHTGSMARVHSDSPPAEDPDSPSPMTTPPRKASVRLQERCTHTARTHTLKTPLYYYQTIVLHFQIILINFIIKCPLFLKKMFLLNLHFYN